MKFEQVALEQVEQIDQVEQEVQQVEQRAPGAADDRAVQGFLSLIGELAALRRRMREHERELAPRLARVDAGHRLGALNLAHYLALRERDRRPLQERLATLGLSSLGRSEAHVMSTLDHVLDMLERLEGRAVERDGRAPVDLRLGSARLERNTALLLGPRPAGRDVRIMVTLPSEAAEDPELIRQMVGAGMNVARINAAHDGPAQWRAMAGHVRDAAAQAGTEVKILIDLGGPKLRTADVPAGPEVLKIRPRRAPTGEVLTPARIGLHRAGEPQPVAGAGALIGVDSRWLASLAAGDRVDFVDARGSRRRWLVERVDADSALLTSDKTCYIVASTRLTRRCKTSGDPTTAVTDLPSAAGRILLERGQRFWLVSARNASAASATPQTSTGEGADDGLPRLGCTLPEVFAQVKPGERIAFDDGRIVGRIREASTAGVLVEVTNAQPGGSWLRNDKGINLPDTRLTLPALTAKDLADLDCAAQIADMVGLSFVQEPADVDMLLNELVARDAAQVGIVLKIETRRAFENLPGLLFAAMADPAVGVMIARGDLAVECGWERLAEVQEEILWAAEAAHLPVIWATQVLETQTKTGQPSRAEITDAAMGVRAECVMLNKGPHIVGAMRTLDDILRRMQAHQSKKRTLLRALKSW